MRLCNTPSSFVPQPLVFPSNAKNQKLRQTLVHTAEVVSRCFLSSQLFVSPLLSTRGRLARTTSETLRRATCFLVFFQRWLKAVFPYSFWADFSLWELNSYFVYILWIGMITVLFFFFSVGLTTSLTVSFQLICFLFFRLFCYLKAIIVRYSFSIFSSRVFLYMGHILVGCLWCSFLIN